MELFFFMMIEKLRPFVLMNMGGWSGIIFLQTVFKPEEDSKFSERGILLLGIGGLCTCVVFLFKYVIKSHKESKEAGKEYSDKILKMNTDNFDAWQRLVNRLNEEHDDQADKMEKMLRESWKVITENTESNNKVAAASENMKQAIDQVKEVLRKELNR